MKIVVTNNLKLSSIPPELHADLTKRLTLPNPKWIENQKMGRWNRGVPKSLRLFDKTRSNGLWIPRGYIRQLILLCRSRDISFELDDRRRTFSNVEIKFQGVLKDFQKTASEAMLAREFGVLCAPTGSGKTVIALHMIAQRSQPALVIVHTKDLAFQWIERIETFLGIPPSEIGLVGAGKKSIGDRITVGLVQSLYKCADEIARSIGFLLVDESHRCPSRTFTEAVSAFDCRYMLGLSATPYRRDKLSSLIFWHLGDLHHTIDSQGLVRSGDIMQSEVIYRETQFQTRIDPVIEYSRMLSELSADQERNFLIASDVAKEVRERAGICLILSDRKAHCENLRAILRYRHKLEAALITGDIPAAERKPIVEGLREQESGILIATGQLLGEGFDFPDLSTLFLATPIKFSGRLSQYIGRILRPSPGKEHARIFDYVDVHVEVLAAAARSRQRVYGRS